MTTPRPESLPDLGLRCMCCWKTYPLEQLGTLRMYKSRTFNVCKDCIAFLWNERHPEVNI